MSARSDLAAAASTVEGVTIHPQYRQGVPPGQGYVRLDGIRRDDTGFGHMTTWQVAVVLSQDTSAAEEWVDAHVDDLLDALADEGAVTGAQPVNLALPDGVVVPVLLITVIRAHERKVTP